MSQLLMIFSDRSENFLPPVPLFFATILFNIRSVSCVLRKSFVWKLYNNVWYLLGSLMKISICFSVFLFLFWVKMNFYKYLNLIVLLFLLEVISNSSADDWKKLKRKLFALTLLHGIRVKTIIPLPVPVPLPVVIKRQRIPVILPPKRVPFLVPKPVPYYQIIPKFVP